MSQTPSKNFILKNISTIICGTIVLFLFLPLLSIKMEMSVLGVSNGTSTSVTGFQTIAEGGLGSIVLLLAPILIIGADYVPFLEKYKK